MWNSFDTGAQDGLISEVIGIRANDGEWIHAYWARPAGPGPYPGIVAVHHLPGWDEFYREFARRLASHGYSVVCPDLYCRHGHGTPDDVAARQRAAGGLSDDGAVGDLVAAMQFLRGLPASNGKVGIIGTCSGGRHAYLTAARTPGGFDAVADLWGGQVVVTPAELNDKMPVAPLDYTKDLTAPVLGLFGNEDANPSPEAVSALEAELAKYGKAFEFHRYDGAGHGFFYYHRPNYRQQQAMDGWGKVFAFFDKHLS
jgi:carboxymethylenebutenolidase